MATSGLRSLVIFCCLIHITTAFGLFDSFISETESCEETCSNTYPVHTYENEFHAQFCARGCRLFSILDSIGFGSLNDTSCSCHSACKEAHPTLEEDAETCIVGCDGQATVVDKMRQKFTMMMSDDAALSPMYPFLYAHDIFSNMFDKINNHISVSWSLYTNQDDGKIIIIQSQPEILIDNEIVNLPDDEDYKTSNYLETNLESVDNSATPNFRHSQLRPLVERSMEPSPELATREDLNSDWLGCIAKKTGLPRMLLSFTIFMSAIVMIWLCFTTAASAPEQRVPAQKLSIYGDLDYLTGLDEKKLLAKVHPQAEGQALALPIKIQVQQV